LKASEQILSFPARVGFVTVSGLTYIGDLANLAGQSAYFTFVGPFEVNAYARSGPSIKRWLSAWKRFRLCR
jgi:hypothetical protein